MYFMYSKLKQKELQHTWKETYKSEETEAYDYSLMYN